MVSTLRNTLGPLGIMLACPPFVMLIWFTNTHLGGSFAALFSVFAQQGILQTIYAVWHPYIWGSSTAWTLILSFTVFELVLMRVLPGKLVHGPVTPKGNTPVYKSNGIAAFLITMLMFSLLTFGFKLIPASILYDNLGELLGALNMSSMLLCLMLYLKGRFVPSTTDSGTTGHVILDYYWGTELYPDVLGWNIKKFITCRFGMMSWGLFLVSYAAKQAELSEMSNSMLISVALQLIYITKFFIWENGYLCSLDIMHDRAGFYICWGCLVWVPCVYTSPSMYLVLHPIHLSAVLASVIFGLGMLSILVNYWADKQRQWVRATQGACTIWGRKPVTLKAHYTTDEGQVRQSILLASGWWGVARHFHYIPEIAATFFWSFPALFSHFSPYFYVCFLSILLFERAFRDDRRCAAKYGQDWNRYCELVPYKIIPLVV